ncbi:MAG: cysteine hydrolase [Gammaproteobacteria bacterium]|nr:cysteine hydrolase [Gammaproteobacteria bacterium]
MENTALILIDIQNDYFPGGAHTLDRPEQAAQNAAKLLNTYREQQRPIIHIQHETTMPDMGFMLPGSFGQEINSSVKPLDNETVFIKHYPSAFWKTNLEIHLTQRNIEHLIIVGMMTHMCVSTTARAAMERGFGTIIIKDACATSSLEFDGTDIPAETVHRTALAELGLISTINSTKYFLSENSL